MLKCDIFSSVKNKQTQRLVGCSMEIALYKKCANVNIEKIECGMEECEPSHSFGPAIRQYCLVHYVERGEGIFEINGKTYKVSAGQIFYIPPRVVTYYQADKNNPWFYRWLGIEGRNVEKLFENGGINSTNPVVNVDKSASEAMREILEKCHCEEKELEISGLVYKFLQCVGARISKSKIVTSAEAYVDKAKDYVQVHLHRKVSVAELGVYLNIDRSYLTALFKKTVGISPQQYIIREKMKVACEYLLTTDYDVSHIAQSVGYEDLFVFSHAFKRIMGQSPTEYRKSV